jgi:hypothetical protein
MRTLGSVAVMPRGYAAGAPHAHRIGSTTLWGVDRLTRAELATLGERWDAGVDALAGGVDPYCASTDWAWPVLDTWGHPEEAVFGATDDAIAAFSLATLDDARIAVMGPDVVWSYAPSIVAPSADRAARAVPAALQVAVDAGASYLVMPGLVPDSALEDALARALARHVDRIGIGMEAVRYQAVPGPTPEEFLARRSQRFRRNLRRTERSALDRGITIEVLDGDPVESAMCRVLAIEQRSWKGREGSGLLGDRMGEGFGAMIRRLAVRGGHRIAVAVLDGADIGFILGGTRGSTYRGLQISYDDDHRDASIGHLLQWHEVQRCMADRLRTYDLGMPLDYKAQWADSTFVTRSLIVRPRRPRRGSGS